MRETLLQRAKAAFIAFALCCALCYADGQHAAVPSRNTTPVVAVVNIALLLD
jgi:hypothetical protein